MLPIHILQDGDSLPQGSDYFLLTSRGIYLRKSTNLIDALVKVDGIAALADIAPYANMNVPALSPEIIVRTLLFFRTVFRKYRSEALVLLYYSPTLKRYTLSCPHQQVGIAMVDYESAERIEGFQLVGSIHSHPTFSSTASSIDHHDEKEFDGLHIIMGAMDQPYFTMNCEIVVNNNRFHVESTDVVNNLHVVDWEPTKHTYYRREMIPRVMPATVDGHMKQSQLFDEATMHQLTRQAPGPFYEVVVPGGKDYRNVGFPTYWLDRVTKISISKPKKQDALPAAGGTEMIGAPA